jgi:hypothetical protein
MLLPQAYGQMVGVLTFLTNVAPSTAYYCTVHSKSSCVVRSDIDSEYRLLIEDTHPHMSAFGAAQTRDLFRYRQKINVLFKTRAELGLWYQQFVRDILVSSS